MDTMFLNIEKSYTPMHTAGIVLFDAIPDFQQVYETIESRLHLVPRFTQRIVEVPFGLGLPFWVEDPDFDLSYHLRHAALPPPGTDAQLCDYAARLISRPLDRTKPLWELYWIEGLSSGRSAIVSKTHHAMIDGAASMDLATVMFDFTPEPPEVVAPPRTAAPPLPSPSELMGAALSRQAAQLADLTQTVRRATDAPAKLFETVRENAAAVINMATSMARPPDPTSLNEGPGPHRRFAFVRSTLQTFKDIKKATDATVNDVILTVCAEGLGKLLRSRGESTEGRTLRAMVPVSIRDAQQDKAVGNELTSVFPDLPIGEMAPLDRLELVHEQMTEIKESGQALGADLLVNLTRWAPATLHALASRLASRARLMNVVISNVPGPQVPLYSCGARMLEPYAVIPLSRGQTLSIGVTSYDGGIYFGLNADRDAHPDLADLADDIAESIEQLQIAAATRTASKVTAPESQTASGSPS